MTYEPRWYWCRITEADPEHEEPDWDRVPEEKRALVRQRWQERGLVTKRWKLWGPQIPYYQRTPGMTVVVEGPV